MMMTLPITLAKALQSAFGAEVAHARRLGGGCIHEVRKVSLADGRSFCLKFQPAGEPAFLDAEADGLATLAPAIRVPAVLGLGESDGHRWLAMEWLDLSPHTPASIDALGHALGQLHAVTSPTFGYHRPNFLGRTPVDNKPSASWSDFYLSRRIEPMLRHLHDAGHAPAPSSAILSAVAACLGTHQPAASLLHGDLWTGNTATLPGGEPVVFDPAVHYGDAESDIAMLELFGGRLPESFFAAYQEHRPLPADRLHRRPAYDLLHALNHLLLFGDAYLAMTRHCLARLGLT